MIVEIIVHGSKRDGVGWVKTTIGNGTNTHST